MNFNNQQEQQQHYHGGIELGPPVAQSSLEARSKFIERTYIHLAGAIAGFVAIETALLSSTTVKSFAIDVMSRGQMGWLIVLGLFMVVSWVADKWARSATSLPLQYAGLALYVVAEAVIFVPILLMATLMAGGGFEIILTAGALTGLVFTALTVFVMVSGIHFGFLRGVLLIGGIAAMGAIGVSVIFGWSLGIWFTALMIAFASGAVLYQTSMVLHDYREGQHVSAALGLFASVALLFWYVLRLVMAFSRN